MKRVANISIVYLHSNKHKNATTCARSSTLHHQTLSPSPFSLDVEAHEEFEIFIVAYSDFIRKRHKGGDGEEQKEKKQIDDLGHAEAKAIHLMLCIMNSKKSKIYIFFFQFK